MREFKFRAWDTIAGRYINSNIQLHTDGTLWGKYRHPIIIEQYTGLKDKNGTDIYEGDIVRILYTDWLSKTDDSISLDDYIKSISKYGKVVFNEGEYVLEIKNYITSIHEGRHGEKEVIGNIHENPDLLK